MPRIKMLEDIAQEQGSYTIKYTFEDEGGSSSTPETMYWWLTTLSGNIVNSRSRVEVSSITNPHYITLQGDDLQMFNIVNNYDLRILTIKGTYNSDRGTGLPFVYPVMFKIINNIIVGKLISISVVDVIYPGDTVNVQ